MMAENYDRYLAKKIADFRVACNHTDPNLGVTAVIITYESKTNIEVVLYVSGVKSASKNVSRGTILSGIPEIMAKGIANELVAEYKKKEEEMPLLEPVTKT